MNKKVFVSVIIPTLDDPMIDQVISLVQRELVGWKAEIIVVGRDEAGRVPRHGTVHFIDTERPVGSAVARNIGIRFAQGEWLFFVDADCLVQSGWAQNLSMHLSKDQAVVGGGVISPTSDYWVLAYNISMFHEFLASNPAGTKHYLPTLNLAVKRDVIEHVGLMDTTLLRGQDIDWTIRMALAGFELYFEPKAIVKHFPRRTDMSTIWRYWKRSGRFNVRNRLRYTGYYRTPKLLSCSSLVRWLSPLVAAWVTAGIFARTPYLLRYIHTAPVVYLTKIAWCLGASEEVRTLKSIG